jgi:HAE1 family hydrophobic/amphiphilic exporter-1
MLEGIPDLNFRVVRPVLFTSNAPLELEIAQDNLAVLRRLAGQCTQRLAQLKELADVETTLTAGAPEVEVVYDREQLMRFGLNLREVAEQVRDLVKGYEATRYNLRDRRIPIVVRLNDAGRENLEQVRNLNVGPQAEQIIPLAAVAHIQLGEGPSEVRRLDGRRIALVRANLGQASLSQAVASMEQAMAELPLPEGTTWRITGQNREWQESRLSLLLAFLLSVFLVYIIMAAQFEDLAAPLLILLTIPLALFGCVLALYLLGLSLSVMALLGIILLCGIVVNNAIVLIDYVNNLRRRGMPLGEAILEAGAVRLRPILMTTLTTVLGLLPMALGFGDGAELRTPMAITVIAGLVVSTLLTLVLIPVFFYQMQGRSLGPGQLEEQPIGEDSP